MMAITTDYKDIQHNNNISNKNKYFNSDSQMTNKTMKNNIIGHANKLNNNHVNYNEDEHIENELALIKKDLLTPAEVTFCNLSSDGGSSSGGDGTKHRRKRLISIDTDADSILSSEMGQKKKPKIPDGGFGWVVVFASLVVSLISDGISLSFGLLYSELLEEFKESQSKTAMIGSLFLAVPLMVGPIMSNLVDQYGCRKMTIVGGLMGGVGFVLASVSTSIEMLFITFGFVAGLGLGIGYVTAVVSIAFWFEKKRTLATSIGATGTGIGTFIFAPFTNWLLATYGWRGTTLVLGGILFNICVCGCLMRDPDWLIEENELESRSQSMQTFSNSSVCLDEIKKLIETGIPKETLLDTLVTNYNTEANQQISDPGQGLIEKKYHSEMTLPTYLTAPEFNDSHELRKGSRRSLRRAILQKDHQNQCSLSISNPSITTKEMEDAKTLMDGKKYLASTETLGPSEKGSNSYMNIQNDKMVSNISLSGFAQVHEYRHGSRLSLDDRVFMKSEKPLLKEANRGASLDILYERDGENRDMLPILPQCRDRSPCRNMIMPIIGPNPPRSAKLHKNRYSQKGNLKRNSLLRGSNYLRNIRVHRNSIHYRGAMLNTHRYRLRASSCPHIFRNSMTTIAREEEDKWYDSFLDIIKSIFDFSLFLDIKFALFNISTLFLFIWFIIPYFYLPQHMRLYNYTDEDSANLIALLGVFNTLGMLILGWIGDQPWLNVSKSFAACLIICGLSVALMPVFTTNYLMLNVLGIVFGLTFASSFSFTPIMLVELVDLDEFTCAYGLVLLVQGIGSLIGPPLAGFIYEITSQWDAAFYLAGFFIAISGLFLIAIAVIEDREEAITNNNGSDKDSTSLEVEVKK